MWLGQMELELDSRKILMKEKNKDEEYANVDSKNSEVADDFVFNNRNPKKFDGKISLNLNECVITDVDEKSSVGHDDKRLEFEVITMAHMRLG
ncbi:hypothetical protein RND71_035109 [Anisodus tanguticus]|uniref:Uncharacterized protein n=1 Tax=Anisodus tanguticus TaxID=243964 RepID=A0AAE1UU69_9SOLA|nr:hypothetical protein RND71_035109 [Anisodus tanguticus]